jgi:hypothetical protein
MTKTQTISNRIAALIATGMAPIDALKAVCGAENVDAMIADLYETLKASR